MHLDPSPRRALAENLLPMINVVFLLRIFFLLAARLAPPSPFALRPPALAAATSNSGSNSGAEPAAAPGKRLVLWLSAAGEMAYQDWRGAAALQALGAARQACVAGADAAPDAQDCARLTLRLDGATPAVRLSALLPQLAELGFGRVAVVARQTALSDAPPTDGLPADGLPAGGLPADAWPTDAWPPHAPPADAPPTDLQPTDLQRGG